MIDKVYTVFGYIGIVVAIGVLIYLVVWGDILSYLL